MRSILKMVLFLAALLTALAQQSARSRTAIDVKNAEVQSTLRKTASLPLSDQQLRVVSVDDEYNVAVGVAHRSMPKGPQKVNGVEHSQITEIYQVISGRATLVTGGALENAQQAPATDEAVKVVNGPSTIGSAILHGISRQVGPGDIVIIPPNTPHWFSAIASDQIVYLVVRMDPHRVLPAGYDARRAP
jgi:mannose-6-phosphate isomerase-like protein (cupin superfamily)